MKIKSLIALFLIVLLSSCSNLLHVEKRQYRNGFHIGNFLSLNKQKDVLLSVKDTAIKEAYYQKDSITSEEEVKVEDAVVLADNDSLIAETKLETLYYLPIVKIPNTEKIKDEDPDDEEEEVKPNVFDKICFISTLTFFLSSLVMIAVWYSDAFYNSLILFIIPALIVFGSFFLTVFSFFMGRMTDVAEKKEKNRFWNKRAWVSFILTIILAALIILMILI
jgi:hypothetical protein